jgi:hypothetical protein
VTLPGEAVSMASEVIGMEALSLLSRFGSLRPMADGDGLRLFYGFMVRLGACQVEHA